MNTVYVRADELGRRRRPSRRRSSRASTGASVTTAEDLADRVSGSLVDAKNLAGTLGDGPRGRRRSLPAFLIASLLTLVVRQQADPRARDAEGARLAAAARRPPGHRRVARCRACSAARSESSLGLGGALLVGALAPDARGDGRRRREAAGRSALRGGPFGQGAVETALDRRARSTRPSSLALIALARSALAAARRSRRGCRRRPPRRSPAPGRRPAPHRLRPNDERRTMRQTAPPVYELRGVSQDVRARRRPRCTPSATST